MQGSTRICKYFEILVGVNLEMKDTWDPLVKFVSKRLVFWNNIFIRLGRRVAVFKSVLNSIYVLSLSFMKMSFLV